MGGGPSYPDPAAAANFLFSPPHPAGWTWRGIFRNSAGQVSLDLLVGDGVDKEEAVHVSVIGVPHARENVLAGSVENLQRECFVINDIVVFDVGVFNGRVVELLESHYDNYLLDVYNCKFLFI